MAEGRLGRGRRELPHPRHALQPRRRAAHAARRRRQPVGDPTQCHAVAIDARAPKFDGGIATRLDCVVFGIVVNRDAERFYDEGEDVWPKRYAIWGRLVAQQPDQIAYSIIDRRSIRMFMPSMFPPIKADTIDELADKLELDPAALETTVAKLQRRRQCPAPSTTPCSTTAAPKASPAAKTHWARTHREAALLRLSAAARHHLHLSRRAREPRGAHGDGGRQPRREHVRRRRDHGRQRARARAISPASA